MKTTVVNLYKDSYDVYIGRAGKGQDGTLGNPFNVKQHGRGKTIELFKEYFLKRIEEDAEFKQKVLQLKGKKLGCFCYPKPCHGDVYVEYLESLDELAQCS